VWSDGCCTIDYNVIIQSAYTTNRRELQQVLARGLLYAAALHVETAPRDCRHGIEQTLARAAHLQTFVTDRGGIKKLEFRYKEATHKVE
jgi:hypothetical protein